MANGYLENTPLSEAVSGYLAFLRENGMEVRTETVRSADALDRVTAEAIYAVQSAPHYVSSAMDGIAVSAEKTFGATETTPVILREGAFVRVDTGDPLPDGCDAVVMIEDCLFCEAGVRLIAAAAPWQHVRQIGEDIAAGDMILPSFEPIEPASVGALLAGGVTEVSVLCKPRVALIPTGDEIVSPSSALHAGEVPEFNSAIFAAMLARRGAEGVVCPIVRDDAALIGEALQNALASCDMALLLAGTSAGRDDDTASVISRLGEVLYHGVAIRPGKPAVLGRVDNKPVVGVPGYPVSGIIVMEELVLPVIDALLHRPRRAGETVCVKMGKRLNSSLKYREFVRASLGLGADGMLTAAPLSRGAGVVSSFTKADCLLDVPQNCEGYEAGDRAFARLLKPIDRIERTVRILGSHDPLIDEAADLLRRADPNAFVSSSHVGSMGAIQAILRGEAQLGGVHLLDEASGAYNEAYIERYVPNGGVALIECVMRAQGLLVQKGNPLHIHSLKDAVNAGARYVNRQRGAGTRVLCDYLLGQAGVSSEQLDGYAREELTHTAVAAQIKAQSADCGLAIYSVARLYDLDFIPVCEEQYDLLVSFDALERPQVRAFLQTLSTPAFSLRLEKLGGYRLDKPGRIRKLWEEKA